MQVLQGKWEYDYYCHWAPFCFFLVLDVSVWTYETMWHFSLFRLLSIAEETLAEFLSKATGTAVEWVQMPGMKVI